MDAEGHQPSPDRPGGYPAYYPTWGDEACNVEDRGLFAETQEARCLRQDMGEFSTVFEVPTAAEAL